MALVDSKPLGALILLEESTSSENGDWAEWPGDSGSFHVFGTFGGSDSVKLQISLDGGTTATDITSASWTAASVGEFSAGNCLVRAVSAIAGTSSINALISKSIDRVGL